MGGFEMYIKYEMIEGKLTQIYVVFDKDFQGKENFQEIPGEVFPDAYSSQIGTSTETELHISS
jgi:hypothetical protein